MKGVGLIYKGVDREWIDTNCCYYLVERMGGRRRVNPLPWNTFSCWFQWITFWFDSVDTHWDIGGLWSYLIIAGVGLAVDWLHQGKNELCADVSPESCLTPTKIQSHLKLYFPAVELLCTGTEIQSHDQNFVFPIHGRVYISHLLFLHFVSLARNCPYQRLGHSRNTPT